MNETTLAAPRNPYRQDGRLDGYADLGMPMMAGRAPRRHDGESGPGLTAGDIGAIARQHFRDGFAAAEREAEEKIEALRADLATAYDEGYTAGRIERVQGLARELHSRILEPQVRLIEARGKVKAGTKAGDAARAGFDTVEEALKDVAAFCAGFFAPHDAKASSRAAGQLARDEA